MYKYVLNLVIKISLMFAQYFEYYTIILRGGAFFVDTVYKLVQRVNLIYAFSSWKIYHSVTERQMQQSNG